MKYIVYIYAMLVFLAMAGCSNDYIYPDTSNMPHGYSLELQKDLEDEWIKIAEEKGLDTRYEWRIELRELDEDGKVIYRGEPRTSSSDNLFAVDSIVYKCYAGHVVCKFKINKSFTINKYYPGSNQIILSPGVDYSVIDPELGEMIYYYGFDISDELGAILDERVSALGYSSSKVELSVTEKDIDGNVLSQRNDFNVHQSAEGAYYADVTITVCTYSQDILKLSVNGIKIPDIPKGTKYILSTSDNYVIEELAPQLYYYGFDISDELGAILDERVNALGYSSSKVELSVTEKDIDGNVLSQRNDFKVRWSAEGAYYADVTITVCTYSQDILKLSVNGIKIPDIPKGTKYILSTSDNYVIEELAPQLYYYGIRWDGRILGVIDEIGESMGGYWISSSIECFITEERF